MKKIIVRAAAFIRRHTLFTFFFVTALTINIVLLGRITSRATEFYSCSSFDRGPLGTYALYTYLDRKKAPVSRMMLAPFEELDTVRDTGKTLVIIAPRYAPGAWEWRQILAWVGRGNRLITTEFFWQSRFRNGEFAQSRASLLKRAPVRVSLPVDSLFPYGNTLPFPQGILRLLPGKKKPAPYTSFETVETITALKPGMLPLLTCDTMVLAAKQMVGTGEWVLFAQPCLFSNTQLKEKAWFDFACRLLTGDGRYAAGAILFDEYHNGYRATKSLWEMLRYYEFDTGIILGAALIVLYLFFTGIRVLPPLDRSPPPSHDVVPGLRSMARLFYRFSAFDGLIKRELALIKRRFPAAPADEPLAASLVPAYLSRAPLPPPFTRAEEFQNALLRAEKNIKVLTKQEKITLFNTLLFIRKELSL